MSTLIRLSLGLIISCSLANAEPIQREPKQPEVNKNTQEDQERFFILVGVSSEKEEKPRCAPEEAGACLDEITRLHAYTLKLAPRSVDKKLKKEHRLWRQEWVKSCSTENEAGSTDLPCLNLLDQRLKALRELTKISLLTITSTISKMDSYVYGDADRTSYDQIYPSRDSKLLSKRAARLMNKRLRPTKENKEIINDKQKIYIAKREFVSSVEHLLGVRQRSLEWCAGCNGGHTPDDVFQWYLRKNLKPLKTSHLFGGRKWRSKLTKLFGEAYQRCTEGHGYPSEELFKLMSKDTDDWNFKSEGISFEYHLAYYHAETCLITWDEISAAGIKIAAAQAAVTLSNALSLSTPFDIRDRRRAYGCPQSSSR